jgi:DNA-binding MarR family transcriptional regulator
MTTLQDVGLAVKRLQWRHHREGNTRLAAVGLSLVQWDVLRHLEGNPGASLHRLAELTFQTDQSMGELAKRMIHRGLLERVEDAGRAAHHRLTADGEQARAAGAGIVDGVLGDSLGHLSPHELSTLYDLLLLAQAHDPG